MHTLSFSHVALRFAGPDGEFRRNPIEKGERATRGQAHGEFAPP